MDLTAVALCFCSALLFSGGAFGEDLLNTEKKEGVKTSVRHFNRLGGEKSPYLLQHKDNPVWWYPWGKEAFKAARDEDKPIFLSIGYATCHWCHVMEHESFEREEVADLLNKHFIAIKVDREERPDIDEVYMKAVQAMTGRGGWPMSVVLTPDLKPFFGGTYFPKAQFMNLLTRIADGWENDRTNILDISERLLAALKEREVKGAVSSTRLDNTVLLKALSEAAKEFDSNYGGFGPAPKFPPSMRLRLLMRIYRRGGDKRALQMAEKTLREMAYGGMYDHLGGGFARYSTDVRWLVPHFEKMLYDNALLAETYLEAYQLTKNELYLSVGLETLDYVLRDMRSPEGGFYSAEDADSDGIEGEFYIWRENELKKVLKGDEFKALSRYFEISATGNFEHGKNILSLKKDAKWSDKKKKPLKRILKKLFSLRSKRNRPLRDDKVLTAWNGLMISALAKGYRVSGDKRYLHAAREAGAFLRKTLWKGGKLFRRYRQGEARFGGVLDDYAATIEGLIELYQADFDTEWIEWALELQEAQDQLFWDPENGGYYYTTDDLLLKTKNFHDGAEPNANSVSALNLLRLHDLTYDEKYRRRALRIFEASSEFVARYPQAFSSMLIGLDYLLDRSKEIAVAAVGDLKRNQQNNGILDFLNTEFLPNAVVALKQVQGGEPSGGDTLPLLIGKTARGGRTTVYVCENKLCMLPTGDLKKIRELVHGFSPIKK